MLVLTLNTTMAQSLANGRSAAAVDLEIYDTKDSFFEYCKELHSDEEDRSSGRPEFMFQDYENIPKKLISECSLNDKLFVYIEAIKDMENEAIEALGLFIGDEDINNDIDFEELIQEFNDEYQGYYDGSEGTELEFAYKYIKEHGILNEMPEHLQYYFDYKAYANDLFVNDFVEHDGHVFRR
jgi:antirestriction protein